MAKPNNKCLGITKIWANLVGKKSGKNKSWSSKCLVHGPLAEQVKQQLGAMKPPWLRYDAILGFLWQDQLPPPPLRNSYKNCWNTVDGSEIPNNHLVCKKKNVVNNGRNYQHQLFSLISEPSTVHTWCVRSPAILVVLFPFSRCFTR